MTKAEQARAKKRGNDADIFQATLKPRLCIKVPREKKAVVEKFERRLIVFDLRKQRPQVTGKYLFNLLQINQLTHLLYQKTEENHQLQTKVA